jgi:cell division protein FtsB
MAGRKRVTVDPEIESLFRTPAIRLQRLINEANELREQMEEKESRIQALTTEREDLIRNVTRLVNDNQAST